MGGLEEDLLRTHSSNISVASCGCLALLLSRSGTPHEGMRGIGSIPDKPLQTPHFGIDCGSDFVCSFVAPPTPFSVRTGSLVFIVHFAFEFGRPLVCLVQIDASREGHDNCFFSISRMQFSPTVGEHFGRKVHTIMRELHRRTCSC